MNCGIDLTNPTHIRDRVSEGKPEMGTLKIAVDGTPVVLEVSSVMDGVWERRVVDLGYSSRKVS